MRGLDGWITPTAALPPPPVADFDDLEEALRRFDQVKEKSSDYKELVTKLLAKQTPDKRFLIRMGQSLRLVHQQDIAYFYTSDKITFMMTREGRKYPVDYTLENLEMMIDPGVQRKCRLALQQIDVDR